MSNYRVYCEIRYEGSFRKANTSKFDTSMNNKLIKIMSMKALSPMGKVSINPENQITSQTKNVKQQLHLTLRRLKTDVHYLTPQAIPSFISPLQHIKRQLGNRNPPVGVHPAISL
jgi:hypothetical protein